MTYERHGARHVYFIDLLVEHRCGHRRAYAVKATKEDVLKGDTIPILTLLSEQYPASFADDYRWVAFKDLDPIAVTNASLITRCGEEGDHEAQAAVRAALPSLGSIITASQIAKASGYEARGLRAAFALIPLGFLRNPPGKRLHLDTPLTNWASQQTANQGN